MPEPSLSMPLFSTDFSIPTSIPRNASDYVVLLRMLRLIPERLIAPMFVLFDITSECTLRCPYCYNSSGSSGASHMDRETMFRIARELVEMKVFSVCVCGGEPTTHPDYVDLIRFFHEHQVLVTSISNGYDLDTGLIKEMARNLVLLQITFDGPDPSTHDRVRGRGSFERAVRAAEELKRHGLYQLRVSFTCTRSNAQSFPRMRDFCRELGADDLRTMPLVPVGRAQCNADVMPTKEDLALVKAQVAEWTSEQPATGLTVEWGEPHQHVRMGLVYGYLLGMNVSPEGYYKITPYLPLAFGNAKRVSLRTAWQQGLGKGWLLPRARPIFEAITSADDFAAAYHAIIHDDQARDGYLDLLTEATDDTFG
jgi:MoaA/NifB/PqqE/SkfB family radical SAM enzyme